MLNKKFFRCIFVVLLSFLIIGTILWYIYEFNMRKHIDLTYSLKRQLEISANIFFCLVLLIIIIFMILILDVYIRYLDERKKRKGYIDYRKTIKGVSRLFIKFVLIDFDDMSYRFIVNTHPDGNIIKREGKYNDFIKYMTELSLDSNMNEFLSYDNILKELEKEDILRCDFSMKSKNNIIWENIALICIERNKSNRPIKILITNQDVDKRKRIEQEVIEELKEAKDIALSANKSKSEFLSRMSHDIRTPLNAILGMSKIANKYSYDEKKVKECLVKIDVSGNHLLRLINEVLDMSKIESSTITLNEEKFNILDVYERTIGLLKPSSDVKKQKITTNLDVENPLIVGDIARIEEIIFNIVGNAIKFTPPKGEIDIKLFESKTTNNDYGKYTLIVSDTGPGLSEENKERIFDPFFRVSNSSGNTIEGSGLGLPIVKKIVEMMNGTITVESTLGKGTTFTVNTLQKHSKLEINDNEIVIGDYSHIKGIIVDDNDFNLEIAQEFLKDTNMQLDIAHSGFEAISKLQNDNYDIVFMDIQMDELDGYDATRKIREFNNEVIIIAMTADAFITDKEKAILSGMNDHISKPIQYKLLMDCLRKWLN